ncbi:FAD-dependent oxidoreductase, partial [Mesorhizobium sp.]
MFPRGMLTIARQDQLGRLEEELERARQFVPSIHRVSPEQALARVPALRSDYVAGAFVEPDCREIDVNELHQGFLRNARKRGGRIVINASVDAIER